MTEDLTAVATKEDMQMIMRELTKLYKAQETWKNEILKKQEDLGNELKEHFALAAEDIKNHFLSSYFPAKLPNSKKLKS